MKGIAFLQGEIITSKNTLKFFKNLLLQNEQANFNESWYKSSLGNGGSKLFK
jgi:hypothetical protein